MDKLYVLYNHADMENVQVIEYKFSNRIKGLYCDGTIDINNKLNEVEKTCILAEELGHHHTTVGNIIDTSKFNNMKQEKAARKWAVNRLITIEDLIKASRSGCEYISDVADYLGVTDKFLLEAIEVFKNTYGIIYRYDNYAIRFNDAGYSVEEIENIENGNIC